MSSHAGLQARLAEARGRPDGPPLQGRRVDVRGRPRDRGVARRGAGRRRGPEVPLGILVLMRRAGSGPVPGVQAAGKGDRVLRAGAAGLPPLHPIYDSDAGPRQGLPSTAVTVAPSCHSSQIGPEPRGVEPGPIDVPIELQTRARAFRAGRRNSLPRQHDGLSGMKGLNPPLRAVGLTAGIWMRCVWPRRRRAGLEGWAGVAAGLPPLRSTVRQRLARPC